MLTLLRFDLKNTRSKMLVYCLIIAAFTAGCIFFWSSSFEGFFNNNNFYWITIFKLGSLGVTGTVCMLCLILVFVTLAQWFSQNLLDREGHFMNMLPVSKTKLFMSKTIAAFIWNFVIIGFIILCIYVFMSFDGRLEQIKDVVEDLMGGKGSLHIGYMLGAFGVFMALHGLTVTILAYTSLCIGQLVNLGRNFVVLLGFVGIGLAQIIIGIVLGAVLGAFNFGGLSSLPEMSSFFMGFCIKMSVVSIVNSGICFALGCYLLSTRLNLD